MPLLVTLALPTGTENSIDGLNVVITVQHVCVFVSGLAISLSLCVGSVFSPALCMTLYEHFK